ncbi:16S rRNA (adenine(1518)-N(6)/adenine(1519)-N(6))-dimethyltransferase RsmA [Patescibacteria group bacterium]
MIKLGQNFLTSSNIAKDIVQIAEVTKSDTVLEVGPGKGILTEELVKEAKQVLAVEKDKVLFDLLQNNFKDQKNLKLVHNDILKFNLSNCSLVDNGYKLVANIPYYLTSHLLKYFLSAEKQPSMIVFMIQKEVGERILAKDGKESILSVSIKAYGQPKIVKNVSAKHFIPKPKVDSVVIKINNISKKFFKNIDEKEFFSLVKQGFSQKRKMLKNNLQLLNTECLIKCGLSEKIRAEDLSLEDWKCLYKNI